MLIRSNVPLVDYSTMRLGGIAAHLAEIYERMEILEALSWAQNHQVPLVMIGGGSNIVWQDTGFPGLVLINRIKHYEVFVEDDTNSYITIGGGEIWDEVVERSVLAGLSGIEALSLIPGTAGATPIQNVGAYGQEIANTLTTIEAYDMKLRDFITLSSSDCNFGYRTSRFKTTDKGRFFITGLTLHLSTNNPLPPFYPAVSSYFTEHKITDVTAASLRAAVIAIRSAKLPDPAVVSNSGSFFHNPIISEEQLTDLQDDFELSIPHWPAENGSVKVSAAWLIEQAGFKDIHDETTGIGTWATQPLVIVNEHAHSTADLLAFKQTVVDAVQKKFRITLVQEPELLPQT